MDNQELKREIEKLKNQAKLNSDLSDDSRKQQRSRNSQRDLNRVSRPNLNELMELAKQLNLRDATISALKLSEERCNMVSPWKIPVLLKSWLQ